MVIDHLYHSKGGLYIRIILSLIMQSPNNFHHYCLGSQWMDLFHIWYVAIYRWINLYKPFWQLPAQVWVYLHVAWLHMQITSIYSNASTTHLKSSYTWTTGRNVWSYIFNLGTQKVEDLFKDWENPVFAMPHKVQLL